MSAPACADATPVCRVSVDAPWLLPLDARELRDALLCMLDAARRQGVTLPVCSLPEVDGGGSMTEGGGTPVPVVELYVVRDGTIAQENRRCMGCQGATNILSFPPAEGMPATLLLSADAVRREALLYGQELTDHLLRLLAHGLGHVLGYDHGTVMDDLCRIMHAAARAVSA